jgi:histidinol-phosphatase
VVDTKPDLTPVSEADRAVEAMIRGRLQRERSGDTVVGEEEGTSGDGRARRWILDPIDGTKSFVRGNPAWATLLAVERDGQLDIGVVSAPALGRRWWAQRGRGAFANGEPIRVSEVARLEDAVVCATDWTDFDRYGRADGWRAVCAGSWARRGWSDFWGHVLVAEGTADVMVEPVLNEWDVAALRVIVGEAGGRTSDLDGAEWTVGAGGLSTNGALHDEVVALLAGRG